MQSDQDLPADAPEKWTVRAAMAAMLRPQIYRMILFIYFPVLIPFTIGLALVGRYLDGLLGWSGILPDWPLNLVLFALFTAGGLLIMWWCYSYLVLVGQGGPAPLVAKPPRRLVLEGPYGLTRHPSIPGKLLGVIGLGFLMRSPFFLLVIVPLLLAGSLVEKYFFMERREQRYWGAPYDRYREQVPFFIPRAAGIMRLLRKN